MTVNKYFQQVCIRLSSMHSAAAILFGVAILCLIVLYAATEVEQERKKVLKWIIFCAIGTLYNIVMYVLIPTF